MQSAGQTLLIWGDIVHVTAIQLDHPQATVKYDSSEADAAATRARLLQSLANDHTLVGAAHIAFPGLGRIRQNGKAYAWLPLNYDGTPGTVN